VAGSSSNKNKYSSPGVINMQNAAHQMWKIQLLLLRLPTLPIAAFYLSPDRFCFAAWKPAFVAAAGGAGGGGGAAAGPCAAVVYLQSNDNQLLLYHLILRSTMDDAFIVD
jgi:hypothetical protein